jgi:hypothetical protein
VVRCWRCGGIGLIDWRVAALRGPGSYEIPGCSEDYIDTQLLFAEYHLEMTTTSLSDHWPKPEGTDPLRQLARRIRAGRSGGAFLLPAYVLEPGLL